jgi:hypothetical protein
MQVFIVQNTFQGDAGCSCAVLATDAESAIDQALPVFEQERERTRASKRFSARENMTAAPVPLGVMFECNLP